MRRVMSVCSRQSRGIKQTFFFLFHSTLCANMFLGVCTLLSHWWCWFLATQVSPPKDERQEERVLINWNWFVCPFPSLLRGCMAQHLQQVADRLEEILAAGGSFTQRFLVAVSKSEVWDLEMPWSLWFVASVYLSFEYLHICDFVFLNVAWNSLHRQHEQRIVRIRCSTQTLRSWG